MPTTKLPPRKAAGGTTDGILFQVTINSILVADDGNIYFNLTSFPKGVFIVPGIPPFQNELFVPPDAVKRETLALALFGLSMGNAVFNASILPPVNQVGKLSALLLNNPLGTNF